MLITLWALGAGCDGQPDASSGPAGDGANAAGNLFANGGFEEGRAPWFSLESKVWGPPFERSDQRAANGSYSARLLASSLAAPAKRTHICGVIQEIRPDTFPRVLRGRYCANLWDKGSDDLYVQMVVVVFGADNPPPGLEQVTNFQIRYPLGGIGDPPFAIGNAQWVFVNTADPPVGEWVSFERDLRQDFLRQWGRVPRGFDKIRVLFEARWDNRQPTDPPATAEVYFDDLYLGPGQ